MNIYWAIASCPASGDVAQKRIEAESDGEAWEKAKSWRREDLGFWKLVAVAKEIPKP